MADIETEFICSICSANKADQQKAIATGINPAMFLSKNAEANYLFAYAEKYGKFPALRIFQLQFPQFPSLQPPEPARFYIDRLIERHTYSGLQKILGKVTKHLRDTGMGAVQECVNEMLKAQELLKHGYSGEIAWNKWDAMHNYVSREQTGTLWLTPYRLLNRMIRGMRAKQLITIAGRPALGKTWLLLYFSLGLWEQGANVLFIEKEMGQEELYERADALYFDLDWIRFLNGQISKAEMQRHEDKRKAFFAKHKARFVVSDQEDLNSNGIESVLAKIIEYQPDVVALDGAYLLDEAQGRTFVEKATTVSRSTKRLAKNRNVLFLQTLQMNRQAEETGGGLETLAWSDAYGQDSDVVIKLGGKKEEAVRELTLLKGRTLTGGMGSFYTNSIFSPKVDLSELGVASANQCVEVSTTDG